MNTLLPNASSYQDRLQSRRDSLKTEISQIVARSTVVTLEVGCGHGHFLTAYAAAHPNKLCVGIDIAGDRIDRACRKRDRAKSHNLYFIRAEARLFLETLPTDALLSEIFVLFPDPWPKVRHHKHRILQPDFLSRIAQQGTTESRLCFRTDYKPYFESSRRLVETHPAWLLSNEPWPFEFSTVFQTRAQGHESLIARRRPPEPHS